MAITSRDAKSYWDPSENPLHRLILLMDVLAISLNRFRQLSFKFKSTEDPDLHCIMDQHNYVRFAVFPKNAGAPQFTADRLAANAIASFPGEQKPIVEATTWLAEMGCLTPHFAETRTCNIRPTDGRLVKRLDIDSECGLLFRIEGELLIRYSSIRSELINALAVIGKSIPDPVNRRLAYASNPWTTSNEPISQETLIEMLHEIEPYRNDRHESVDVDRPLNDSTRIIDEIKEVQIEIGSIRKTLLPDSFVLGVLGINGSKYTDRIIFQPLDERSYSRLKNAFLKIYSLNLSTGLMDQVPDLIVQKADLKNVIQYMNELIAFCDKLFFAVSKGNEQRKDIANYALPLGTGTFNSGKRNRIPRAEAEVRVRDWLAANAKPNPSGITRDAVAKGTGVSAGQVSNTAAWKAFCDKRTAEKKQGAREVPLTDSLLAAIPQSAEKDDELAELFQSQEADEIEQKRRHERRQSRRHELS